MEPYVGLKTEHIIIAQQLQKQGRKIKTWKYRQVTLSKNCLTYSRVLKHPRVVPLQNIATELEVPATAQNPTGGFTVVLKDGDSLQFRTNRDPADANVRMYCMYVH